MLNTTSISFNRLKTVEQLGKYNVCNLNC